MEKTAGDDDLLENVLSTFLCREDADIQWFLHTKAVEFERLAKSRTYLIVDQDQLQERGMSLNRLTIYGYISLAIKVLTVPEKTSNRTRQKIDGLSAKARGKLLSHFSCYLIGQLARNSCVPKASISGMELLNFAYDIVASAVEAVGGRYILIECHDDEKLVQFYLDNGFEVLSRIPDEDKKMVQMLRRFECCSYTNSR